jgi:hypothetical protein
VVQELLHHPLHLRGVGTAAVAVVRLALAAQVVRLFLLLLLGVEEFLIQLTAPILTMVVVVVLVDLLLPLVPLVAIVRLGLEVLVLVLLLFDIHNKIGKEI